MNHFHSFCKSAPIHKFFVINAIKYLIFIVLLLFYLFFVLFLSTLNIQATFDQFIPTSFYSKLHCKLALFGKSHLGTGRISDLSCDRGQVWYHREDKMTRHGKQRFAIHQSAITLWLLMGKANNIDFLVTMASESCWDILGSKLTCYP